MCFEIKMVNLQGKDKSKFVSNMFNRISGRYDLLNTIMTAGMHYSWRKKATKYLKKSETGMFLDVATGTGDFAFEILNQKIANKVVGLDFSVEMLNIGQIKSEKRNFDKKFVPVVADAHELPFADNSFESITIGFGVRNFVDLSIALEELLRVLVPGGNLVILEIVKPEGKIMSRLFPLYFEKITPRIGSIFAGDREAYTYLPQSVSNFLTSTQLAVLMTKKGFKKPVVKKLAFGTVAIVVGQKNE
ncbi:MAG: bifunctional demethylmenaquinone methyltransferase/2-methoxy-6-polyprenyl-1,4-benzoquinol methylase UbiE [Chloroflexi bacterium]|nr:MAG: bifunctional demethylmenaquinone methyltransferase/2-methoxy-6-polyprenyl-1,4-benzoquinol methylase UbiE [SAR202 cluster bacterium]MAO74759.1 bifunctional demethylmenaquinone methyltransferase/2-methoxy-6-polyprenyl-1,4-benzoquinol methylase UbiE [Chloroflexota bacterium]MBR49015.1 bifunctional demethylmenaquinone methyltransferase/2-methoxy-6-polyprenyl-1,4-benzoquinol methylase UbiE [Chloroflexota bacterium]